VKGERGGSSIEERIRASRAFANPLPLQKPLQDVNRPFDLLPLTFHLDE
jgi:hypothetical protein